VGEPVPVRYQDGGLGHRHRFNPANQGVTRVYAEPVPVTSWPRPMRRIGADDGKREQRQGVEPGRSERTQAAGQREPPTGIIAMKLGRTEGAVRSTAPSLGVSLNPPNRSPYNFRKK
jgi:hypothetical protein